MRFEWDDEKNRANRKKHDGLDFETASLVFEDPNLVLRKDRVVEGEQRWHAIGSTPELPAVLLVVHVYREDKTNAEEIIRIISTREAGQRECRIHLQQASY